MKRIFAVLALMGLAGCIGGASAPRPKLWTLAWSASDAPAAVDTVWPLARVGTVTVAAPFDGVPITVLRADGSLGRDPANHFAAPPAALVKYALANAMEEDGRFGTVLNSLSTAATDVCVDAAVSEIALDCSAGSSRHATVKLDLAVIDTSRAVRTLVCKAHGEGRVNAASGNWSAAFSAAASNALRQALGRIKK